MSIETLVVAIIIFAVLWLILTYAPLPAPIKQIATWILYGAAAIWIVTHLRALLHLQVG